MVTEYDIKVEELVPSEIAHAYPHFLLRAKDPKVRHAQVCMSVAGLVLQGVTGSER